MGVWVKGPWFGLQGDGPLNERIGRTCHLKWSRIIYGSNASKYSTSPCWKKRVARFGLKYIEKYAQSFINSCTSLCWVPRGVLWWTWLSNPKPQIIPIMQLEEKGKKIIENIQGAWWIGDSLRRKVSCDYPWVKTTSKKLITLSIHPCRNHDFSNLVFWYHENKCWKCCGMSIS